MIPDEGDEMRRHYELHNIKINSQTKDNSLVQKIILKSVE